MGVREAFDSTASDYDRSRRLLIPRFDDFYGTAIDRIPFERDRPIRVLDMGAGTGLMSQMVADLYPNATFVLVDVAASMLEKAKQRFRDEIERFEFVVANLADHELPTGFDLAISALAIHHLSDEEKRGLFERVSDALVSDGIFINCDQALGPTPQIEDSYEQAWLDEVRSRGVDEDTLRVARDRMKEDRSAKLEDQLRWLRETGFVDVDCWFKHYRFIVLSATKPTPTPTSQ